MTIENVLAQALANPEEALRQLDIMDCAEGLSQYIKAAWPLVETVDYMSNWHVDCIADHLEAAGAGEFAGKTLLINMPPGHQKSLTVSVFWPSWEWGPNNNAGLRFMFTAYRADLALRDASKSRMLIESQWYQDRWGDRFHIMGKENQKQRYANNKMGYRFSTSTAGVMGEGGDIVVFDDPHNVLEAESDDVRDEVVEKISWALPTRIRSKKGCSVVVMQRLHEKDYSGHLLESEYDDLIHLCLPARYEVNHPTPMKTPLPWKDPRTKEGELLFPALFDEDRIDKLESKLSSKGGNYAIAGQLQQRPAPREGGLFERDWFQIVKKLPTDIEEVHMVRGWDFAGSERKKSPWTVGVKIFAIREALDPDFSFYIVDVERLQGSPGKVEKCLKDTSKKDGYDIIQDIPQDPGQAGKSQVQRFVKMLPGYEVRFSPESGSKELRASAFSAQAEGMNVFLLKGAWNEKYISEFENFPKGSFKDQVDATSRAFQRLLVMIEEGQGSLAGATSVPKG